MCNVVDLMSMALACRRPVGVAERAEATGAHCVEAAMSISSRQRLARPQELGDKARDREGLLQPRCLLIVLRLPKEITTTS